MYILIFVSWYIKLPVLEEELNALENAKTTDAGDTDKMLNDEVTAGEYF